MSDAPAKVAATPKRDDFHLTRARAEAFAEEIRDFWSRRGLAVRVWLEPLNNSSTTEFVVRSDLSLVERRP